MRRFLLNVAGVFLLAVAACNMPEEKGFAPRSGSANVPVDPAGVARAREAEDPAIEPRTFYASGRLFEATGSRDKAIDMYTKALTRDPGFAEAYNRLGIVLGAAGRHREAETHLHRACDLEPGNAAMRNNLGFEFVLQRRWRDAEREFRRALMLDPGFHRARVNLGVSLGAQKRFDEALAEFRRVLPEADAQYNLGLALRAHQRCAEARRAFARALRYNPRLTAARRQIDRLPKSASTGRGTPVHPVHASASAGSGAGLPTIAPAEAGPGAGARADAPGVAVEREAAGPPADADIQLSDDLFGAFGQAWENAKSAITFAHQARPGGPAVSGPAARATGAASPDVGDGSAGTGAASTYGPQVPVVDGSSAARYPPIGRPARLQLAASSTQHRRRLDVSSPEDAPPAAPPGPGDFDEDGCVTLADYAFFRECLIGHAVTAAPACRRGDFDGDQDVDLLDFLRFQAAVEP